MSEESQDFDTELKKDYLDRELDKEDWKILGAVIKNIMNEKEAKKLKGCDEE